MLTRAKGKFPALTRLNLTVLPTNYIEKHLQRTCREGALIYKIIFNKMYYYTLFMVVNWV